VQRTWIIATTQEKWQQCKKNEHNAIRAKTTRKEHATMWEEQPNAKKNNVQPTNKNKKNVKPTMKNTNHK
jgi:hypothetical protein